MDIILIALVALFLVWKFRNILNKEQTFIKNPNTMNSMFVQNPKSPNEKRIEIMKIPGIQNTKKNQVEQLDKLFQDEKQKLPENLHHIYQSVLLSNPNFYISKAQEDVKDIYEEIIISFAEKTLFFTKFSVEGSLNIKLQEKIQNLPYKICLVKILEANVSDLILLGKNIQIVFEVISHQLLYKEDENGNVTEGSKITPVTVKEKVQLLYVSSSGSWVLQNIFQS